MWCQVWRGRGGGGGVEEALALLNFCSVIIRLNKIRFHIESYPYVLDENRPYIDVPSLSLVFSVLQGEVALYTMTKLFLYAVVF